MRVKLFFLFFAMTALNCEGLALENLNSLITNSQRFKLSQVKFLNLRKNRILADFKKSILIKNGLFAIAGRKWPDKLNGKEELQIIEYKSAFLDEMTFFNVSLIDDSRIPIDGPSTLHIANTFVRFKKDVFSLTFRNSNQQASDGLTVDLTNFALAKAGDTFKDFATMIQLTPLLIEGFKKQSDKKSALQEILTLCFYFSQYTLKPNFANLDWIQNLAALKASKDMLPSLPAMDKLATQLARREFPDYTLSAEKNELSGLVHSIDEVYFIELSILKEDFKIKTTRVAKSRLQKKYYDLSGIGNCTIAGAEHFVVDATTPTGVSV